MPALGRLRQEDYKFEASRHTWQDPVSKHKHKTKEKYVI
jgi:hypothetical protein